MPSDKTNPYRLSRNVLPTRYDLALEPDLDAAIFSGSVDIAIEIASATSEIVLNAIELKIGLVSLTTSGGESVSAREVSLDEETARATLKFTSEIPAGNANLHISFRGILNDKLHGFYRSSYTDDDGVEHIIATTQLQSTDARRAFPCFDEPDFKAVFGITLTVPEDLFAVSCGPTISDENLGDGRREVKFCDTMIMSTYLVAFIVGPFEATEPVDVDGVPLRVVHPVGKGNLTAYALEVGEFCLRHFSEYYDIPYPGNKVDLIAVPDFAAGAMENLGCITFREVLVLVDPEKATQGELMRVADVIAHELAHMWFGDLVTMRWWNGIWLNEAFATFMDASAVDSFKPAWERWVQFALERSMAFDVDSLKNTRTIEFEVDSPVDAEGMFDLLTYEKGGSVLRMLEQYLGASGFRDGIRHYLKSHAYGNTETGDLWDAIEEITEQPARRIMDSWIFQEGFPIVSVALSEDRETLTVSQRRFGFTEEAAAADTLWSIPLVIRLHTEGSETEIRALLESKSQEIALTSKPDVVVVNAGGDGFYRVEYTAPLRNALTGSMYEVLAPVERYGLVDDTYASVQAGGTSVAEFLDFTEGFVGENDPDVWAALAQSLGQISRIVEGDVLDRFRARVRELVTPAQLRLGWEASDSDSERDLELRSLLIGALAITGNDSASQATAREMYDRYLENTSSIEPNVAAAIARVVAHRGDEADFERFVDRFNTPATPQEETRYMYALGSFPDAEQIERTLEMTLNGEIRTQNAPFVLAYCMMNRHHGVLAWEFVKKHWKEMNDKYPRNTIARMLTGVRALSKTDQAADVEAFFEDHDVPQGALMLQQHLEKMRINVAFREREADRLPEAI